MTVKKAVTITLILGLVLGVVFSLWGMVGSICGFGVGSFYTFAMMQKEADEEELD